MSLKHTLNYFTFFFKKKKRNNKQEMYVSYMLSNTLINRTKQVFYIYEIIRWTFKKHSKIEKKHKVKADLEETWKHLKTCFTKRIKMRSIKMSDGRSKWNLTTKLRDSILDFYCFERVLSRISSFTLSLIKISSITSSGSEGGSAVASISFFFSDTKQPMNVLVINLVFVRTLIY